MSCSLGLFFSSSLEASGVGVSYGVGINDALVQSGSTNGSSVRGMVGHLYRSDKWINDKSFAVLPEWITRSNFALDIEWHELNSQPSNEQIDELTIVSIKPSLTWQLSRSWEWDLAIGIASLSDRKYEEIETSSSWQFATHIGLNWTATDSSMWRTSLRYNHFSNGYLNQPNPGIDFVTITISRFW